MLTVVDCVVGNVSRRAKEGEHAVLYLPHLNKFSLCVAQVHTSSISLSVLSLLDLGMATLLWSGFYQLPVRVNWQMLSLSQRVSSFTKCGQQAVLLLDSTLDVIHPTIVCHHSFVSTVLYVGTFVKVQLLLINFPSRLTRQPSGVGESDSVDHHFLSPTTINPLAVHHFTSCHIDL